MLTNFLIKHGSEEPISFHMPGHKGADFFRKLDYEDYLNNIVNCDITEIPGADNLFQAESGIKSVMDKYTSLYEVQQSYLLINGSSVGIIASILASVPKGGKMIVARNSHKSIFNALGLGQIEPLYAYPEIQDGISGPINPQEIENLILENKDVKALILPSPNYYGICSDIKTISKTCDEHSVVLIVDQAHGAHLKFFNKYIDDPSLAYPLSAEEQGADIVINSTHKTLASFTQSAILNFNTGKVDKYLLEDKLQILQSTSPSYILMSSLDINADILKNHGKELILDWANNVEGFYKKISKLDNIKLINTPNLDRTKINIDMSAYGIDGAKLERALMDRKIYPELFTGNILMLMTGIGNTADHMKKLYQAIIDIVDTSSLAEKDLTTKNKLEADWNKKRKIHKLTDKKIRIPFKEAENRICASSIIPYPPGIPFICPGEMIERSDIEYLTALRQEGEKVIGLGENYEVLVNKE